jgi:hypothetical protein
MPDYKPPEHIHSPAIRKALRPLAEDIQKESGSKKVILIVTYELDKKTEKMNIQMHVSDDNTMERTDASAPKPKGDKLALDAEAGLRTILNNKPKDQGE